MTITRTQDGTTLTLALNGRLDTTTAPQLQEVLLPAFDGSGTVKLDFSELAYISSAGLRVLLLAQKTAKAKSASFQIGGVSPDVMEVLEMTGFSDILTIVP